MSLVDEVASGLDGLSQLRAPRVGCKPANDWSKCMTAEQVARLDAIELWSR